jgi:hypothetical protein
MPLSNIVFPTDPNPIMRNRRMYVFAFSVLVEEIVSSIFEA